MSFSSVSEAVKARGFVKRSLTKLKKEFEEPNLNHIQLTAMLNQLQPNLSKFDSIQTYIELNCSDDEIEEVSQERDDFLKKYYNLEAEINELLNVRKKKSPSQETLNSRASNSTDNLIKLPTIKLPSFNGEYSEFITFKNTFDSLIVNNSTLDNVQKLHYLLASLEGEPKQLLANMELTSENFIPCYNLIVNRYLNRKLILNSHVKGLLTLSSATDGNAANYRKLVNQIRTNLNGIDSVESNIPIHELLITELVLNKIKYNHRLEFENKYSDSQSTSLNDLIDFLESKSQTLELLASKNVNVDKPIANKTKAANSKAKSLHVTQNQEKHTACIFCKQNQHRLTSCSEFKALEPHNRLKFVKTNKLCFKCLLQHKVGSCQQNKYLCCQNRHNVLLHVNRHNRPTLNGADNLSANVNTHTALKTTTAIGGNVLLATAIVNVKNKHGQLVKVRALVDSASQLSFVTKRLVNKLGLRQNKLNLPIAGIGNSQNNYVQFSCNLQISSVVTNFSLQTEAAVLGVITSKLPNLKINIDNWNIPSRIKLADPSFNVPNDIDLLLGAEVFSQILLKGQLTKPDHPVLQETKLGWIVYGKCPVSCLTLSNARQCHFVKSHSLEETLTKFWEIEDLPSKSLTPEEIYCENHFTANVSKDPDGSYVVKLPIKVGSTLPTASRHTALKRLKQMESRFSKNPELRESYVNFMQEYIALEHMEPVTSEPKIDNPYYLPHHAVFKESSTTTKLRTVFDGSAPSQNGVSLNSILLVGPTVQPDLISIVLNFRLHLIAISADITKMYRCVKVHPDDRDYQRILWRNSPKDEIQDFRLATVTYGTSSAAFLATRCLNHIAETNENSYPAASDVIKNCFYVDDLLFGASNLSEVKTLQHDVTSLLYASNFHLKKWTSNCEEAISHIPLEDREQTSVCPLTKEDTVKTLGIQWIPKKDLFQFNVNVQDMPTQFTKRAILSSVASIFDPIGLLAPAILKCKVLLQSMWALKVHWDEPLESDSHIAVEWNHIASELPLLNSITIPRKIIFTQHPVVKELHGFSDASELAYSACVYLRTVSPDGDVNVSLVTSKSRVAPLKKQSIPRLELCGALLLSRLMKKVLESLKLSELSTYYWTDSTIVLHWLQRPSGYWKTFVANRVSEIQSSSDVRDWRHVPSAENPADALSRGVYPSQLIHLHIWWQGPDFLKQTHSVYSNFTEPVPVEDALLEIKPSAVTLATTISDMSIFEKYSSYRKLIRVVSYIFRFIRNATAKRDKQSLLSGELTPSETIDTTLRLIKLVQTSEFSQELHDISNGELVSGKGKLKSLSPYLDSNGLLLVGGRLQNADLTEQEKHPIILPPKHPFTRLLIKHEHENLLHSGPQHTLFSLRKRYWIINGKNMVRHIIRSCLKCFRTNPTKPKHIMGQLPSYRVNITSPFTHTGVDYAGPFIIKGDSPRSKIKYKAYLALFVCMATKSLHLELVRSLSTEDFIAALKRFIARRGKPAAIYSDNGTNFVGAHNEFRRFISDNEAHIINHATNADITWRFIPPASPHFGGIWEAGVKSVKSLLKKVIGNAVLSAEELSTLFCQIEACLNSRPLCSLSDDPDCQSFLTPGHFLIGRNLNSIPEVDLSDCKLNTLTRWRLVQQLLRSFWTRWSKDYLHSLQQRNKWTSHGQWSPQLNDLVLVREDNLPPLIWKVGRIVELHPGNDNVTRVVTIKTANGTIKRAIIKLSPLPLPE